MLRRTDGKHAAHGTAGVVSERLQTVAKASRQDHATQDGPRTHGSVPTAAESAGTHKSTAPRSPFAARTGERCSRGGVGVADTSSQTRTARRVFRLNSGSWNSTWCRLAAISALGRPRRSKPRIFLGAVRRARHENARSKTKERVRRYDQYHQGAPMPRVRTRTHMRAQPCSLSSPPPSENRRASRFRCRRSKQSRRNDGASCTLRLAPR